MNNDICYDISVFLVAILILCSTCFGYQIEGLGKPEHTLPSNDLEIVIEEQDSIVPSTVVWQVWSSNKGVSSVHVSNMIPHIYPGDVIDQTGENIEVFVQAILKDVDGSVIDTLSEQTSFTSNKNQTIIKLSDNEFAELTLVVDIRDKSEIDLEGTHTDPETGIESSVIYPIKTLKVNSIISDEMLDKMSNIDNKLEKILSLLNEKEAEKININSATLDQLESIDGIGSVLAERILEDRNINGPFNSKQDLQRVFGIGDYLAESIDNQVTY